MNCSNMKKLLSEMEFQYSKKFSFSMVITQDCKWFLFLASLFSCFFPIHCLKIHWIVSRVYSNKKLWGLWSCTFCFNIRPKKKNHNNNMVDYCVTSAIVVIFLNRLSLELVGHTIKSTYSHTHTTTISPMFVYHIRIRVYSYIFFCTFLYSALYVRRVCFFISCGNWN